MNTSAWEALRKRSGVECRFHDLRHTAATKMAEADVPESTMLAIMGHMKPGDAGEVLSHSDGRQAKSGEVVRDAAGGPAAGFNANDKGTPKHG